MTDKEILILKLHEIKASINKAYNDLIEVYSQRQMMDEPIPEGVKILRQTIIDLEDYLDTLIT